MVNIHELDLVGDRVKEIRRLMVRALRGACDAHQGDLAGFTLVSWDMRGAAHSFYVAEHGPISPAFLPLYVQHALNRHVTVDLVQQVLAEDIA